MLEWLDRLKDEGVFIDEDLAGVRTLEGRPPIYADGFPTDLYPAVIKACQQPGIERPYVHQAEAIEGILAGEDLVLVSPTATGKTLCFNLPIISNLLKHRTRHALYLYPMKVSGRLVAPAQE